MGIIDPPLAIEPVGIAIPNDDPQFANLVRNYLNTLEKTGLNTRLRQKWFEDDSWIATLP
jgi:polar amino acid transport system substrate-binding protein